MKNLQFTKEKIVPFIKMYANAYTQLFIIFKILDELGSFITNLEVKDKPSRKIREYIETKLSPMLSELPKKEVLRE